MTDPQPAPTGITCLIERGMDPEDEREARQLERAQLALGPMIEAMRGLDLSPYRSEGIPALAAAPGEERE